MFLRKGFTSRYMRPPVESISAFDGPERRSRIRFPIALSARYQVLWGQEIEGTGRTVNISSYGVLITSAHDAPPGTSISVVINWPILKGNACPLALHTQGTVVRSDHGLVAVRFSTHESRPQPKPLHQVQSFPRGRVRSR
jgi:hypothetical protein